MDIDSHLTAAGKIVDRVWLVEGQVVDEMKSVCNWSNFCM